MNGNLCLEAFFSSLFHGPSALPSVHRTMASNPATFHLITNLRRNEDTIAALLSVFFMGCTTVGHFFFWLAHWILVGWVLKYKPALPNAQVLGSWIKVYVFQKHVKQCELVPIFFLSLFSLFLPPSLPPSLFPSLPPSFPPSPHSFPPSFLSLAQASF